MTRSGAARSVSERLYALILHVYPRELRDRFGDDMRDLFRDECKAARRRAGWSGVARLWLATLPAIVFGATAEHFDAARRRAAAARIPSPTPNRSDSMLSTMLRDLRYAGRMLRKSPVFTIIAVLIIALGTGAVTTIFSAVNSIALRSVPGVPNARELMEVNRMPADGNGWMWASYPYYLKLRDGGGERPVADLAAWAMMPLTISTGNEGIAAQGTMVSGNYFRVMGLRPALGRLFTPDEEGPGGAHPVAVISHGFWTRQLAGDSAVIGRTVRLNGNPVTIVGVAPPGFHGVFASMRTDAWVTLAMQPQLRPRSDIMDPGPTWLSLVARVRPGVSREAVQRELTRLTTQYIADGIERAEDHRFSVARVEPLSGLPSDMNGKVLGFMALLLGAAALVLLIANTNVAAMLLARAVARRRETAVRFALGATRGRLVRQLLTETLLLYTLGAAGGVLLAVNVTRLLGQLSLPIDTPFGMDVSLDGRVLAFALFVSLATGLASGIAPALQSARADINARMRNDSAGAGSRRSVTQTVLIAGQMALSFMLLVAAGLFLRALDRGHRVELGFDTSNVAVASFDIGTYGYDDAKGRNLVRTVKQELARTPGVVAVSFARDLPLNNYDAREDLQIDGTVVPPATERGTSISVGEVDDGYFDVMKIPMMEGRGFAPSDDERAPRVAVVNQAFARRFWPAGAIGRTLRRGNDVITVVGVARDAKYSSLRETRQPYVYFAFQQTPAKFHTDLLVRTSGDPSRFAPAIRSAARDFDASIPAPAVTTLSATIGVALLPQQVAALVTAVLGVVGLLLAAVGLYGVVAYLVGQRTREIGVRLALGASRGAVLRLIVGEGMRPVAVGLGVGVVLALGATRLLRSYLFGVSPLDAVTYIGGATMLTVVALTASYLPARRAAATDPVRALRSE